LDDLEGNGMIERREDTVGRRTVAFYRPTQKRIAFCRDILEPYEKIFPRRKNENKRPTLHTGKRLTGIFYENDGSIEDEFAVTKEGRSLEVTELDEEEEEEEEEDDDN
jgi:DNA-binding PadR family transcriptional regulator